MRSGGRSAAARVFLFAMIGGSSLSHSRAVVPIMPTERTVCRAGSALANSIGRSKAAFLVPGRAPQTAMAAAPPASVMNCRRLIGLPYSLPRFTMSAASLANCHLNTRKI